MSFTYNINLGVFGSNALDGVIAQLDRMEKKLSMTSQGIWNTSRAVKSGFAGMGNSVTALDSKVDQAHASILSLGTATKRSEGMMRNSFANMGGGISSMLAQVGAAAFTLNSLKTTADMDSLQRSILFAGGAEGAENLRFVNETARTMKMDVRSAMEGFKSLSGAMMGTSITTEQTRDIFRSTSIASKVMGLNAEDTKLSFLALGQMASKGVLSMEELRQQLGERIPGAFNMGSRALNMTTMAFNKLVAEGKITSEQFLPAFAKEMEKTFGPGLANAMEGPASMFAEFNNSILDLKMMIGTELMPTATAFVNDFLKPSVKWLGENKDAVKNLVLGLGTFYATIKTFQIAGFISTVVGSVGTIGATTGAIGTLSAALTGLTGPLGWIVAGAAALVGHTWNLSKNTNESQEAYWHGVFGVKHKDRGSSKFADGFDSTVFGVGTYSTKSSGAKTPLSHGGASAFGMPEKDNDGALQKWGPGRAGLGIFTDPNSAAPPPNASLPELSKGISGINEGGRHSKVINISLGNMVERLEINAATAEQGMDDMVDMLTRKLTQIINNANQVQTTF